MQVEEIRTIPLSDLAAALAAVAEIESQLLRAPVQLALFRALRTGRYHTHDELAEIVYADDQDGGPLSARGSVSTLTYNLRPRLAEQNLFIKRHPFGVVYKR
jgi:hypothetical protein